MSVAWRIAQRELRAQWRGGLRGFRIFLACLVLGVAAIGTVGTVRSAISDGLSREGAVILGGDAEMEFTYRGPTVQERAFMEAISTEVSETIELRSMAGFAGPDGMDYALTQLRAVDAAYPLYGTAGLVPAQPIQEAIALRDGRHGAVMQQVLIDRLGMRIGDVFTIGTAEFELRAALETEPDGAAGGFGLGPRSIVSLDGLASSGLIQPGTLYETEVRLKLPEGADFDRLRLQMEEAFPEGGIRWQDSRRAAPGVERFVDRIGTFLVLVGLAGLAVGGVGIAAAVRAYLENRLSTIAILKTIGAEGRTIFAAYFIQIVILGGLGVLLGVALGALLPLLAAPFLAPHMPVDLDIGIAPSALIEAASYGALTALIFTLLPLAQTERLRAAAIFRDAASPAIAMPRARYLAALLGLCAALLGLALWRSGVPILTLGAAGGIAAALALLWLAAWGLRQVLRKIARGRSLHGRVVLRAALAAIAAPRSEATAVMISLGLGLSVLAAVGQISSNLQSAIDRDLPEVAPSYFFVDIQPNQIDDFLTRTTTDPAVSRVETAPMLRGIVTGINGQDARNVAGDHWVVRGDRGLTYLDEAPPSEQIVAGSWWPVGYDGPPLMAFAAEEAAELGVGLGDQITVNVLGRDITATIAALREVDFSNAGIGFVITLSSNALAGAPHTFIATVYAEEEAEAQLLRDLAGNAPNITAIRIRDALDRVAEALGAIATATALGAGVTLITGLVVLIGAAASGERARSYEAALLKTLGATRAQILISFALRSALLGAMAGLVALAAGTLGGFAVMEFVMQAPFRFDVISAVSIIGGGALVSLLAGLGYAWRPLRMRPAGRLRAKD
ncbi:FtsX-like permease family protein [Rhodobacteraceae bacterium XHP0102]|nr:FtsX-like permease family protein [Rhodobacteraceae bacterium XHP0102]